MAKKAKKSKKKKKSLKHHAKELHDIGKKYTKHALDLNVLHKQEKTRKEIKKQIQKIEKNLKKLMNLAGKV
ncbi:hypothetical protein GF343_01345 [Candidatus Woesearchaeota archaeon]|nr:hypothetical protein [Candidatus Woesearchaeota archaeon]